MSRISKDEYYLGIANAVSRRSTCNRRQYGAVIVKDDMIVATGYNGAARGEPNCCDTGKCVRQELDIPPGERYELCVAIHAEDNALTQAGREALGAKLYLYGSSNGETIKAIPCKMCARKIKNSGIIEVIVSNSLGVPEKWNPAN